LYILGPDLHHSSGQTPHVPTVAVYRECTERCRQLADNGVDVPGHEGRRAGIPGQRMRSESISGRVDQ
jgi:hypothetical protein